MGAGVDLRKQLNPHGLHAVFNLPVSAHETSLWNATNGCNPAMEQANARRNGNLVNIAHFSNKRLGPGGVLSELEPRGRRGT
jgi:hypothetical protein